MTGLGILLLIVVFFWIIWPVIARWLKRKAMERAEDYMRSSMGMPPRDKKKKSSDSYKNQSSQDSFYRERYKKRYGSDYKGNEPIIPKEYAEDVEYTETIDYSSTRISSHSDGKTKTYHESQISDAEWIEIKTKRNK